MEPNKTPSPVEVINFLQTKHAISFHAYFESYRIAFNNDVYVSVTEDVLYLVDKGEVIQTFSIENYTASALADLISVISENVSS